MEQVAVLGVRILPGRSHTVLNLDESLMKSITHIPDEFNSTRFSQIKDKRTAVRILPLN